jgi:hypothetical protein
MKLIPIFVDFVDCFENFKIVVKKKPFEQIILDQYYYIFLILQRKYFSVQYHQYRLLDYAMLCSREQTLLDRLAKQHVQH